MRDKCVSKMRKHTPPMTVLDGFIYNFLAVGVIFPWVYLWGPAAFPGCDIRLAILIAFFVQIPIALSYSVMACTYPANGGDYVYQTRAFGLFGAVCVMSGFVAWILQWIALSGVLFAQLGLAPLLMAFGVRFDLRKLTIAATLVESPGGTMLVTIALAVATVVFLGRGLRIFVLAQRMLFTLTVAAMCAMLFVFTHIAHPQLSTNLDMFVGSVLSHLDLTAKVPVQMVTSFMDFTIADVHRNSILAKKQFSILATLGVVPIAWTSLQWSTYSVEQNAEIRGCKRIANQLFMLVGSAAAVTIVLIVLSGAQATAFPSAFTLASALANWNGEGSPFTVSFLQKDLQPFPSIIAMAACRNIVLSTVIALGFLANAFQVTCNCFIGMSKIIVRMSHDGTLPEALKLHKLSVRTNAPKRAYWFYLVLSLPVIIGYFLISNWKSYTLGVTFACGYVFAVSSLAAARIPWSKPARRLLAKSELKGVPRWAFVVLGVLSFVLCCLMTGSYVFVGAYKLRNADSTLVIGAVIIISTLVILLSRRLATKKMVDLKTANEVDQNGEGPNVPQGQEGNCDAYLD
jgi:amino acid transporter